jgi:putative ABC transport system permease protein
MFRYFFKISFRNLLNHSTYSIINILGLATGLTCFIVIMLWVKFEFSYDKFHTNSGLLYRVAFTNQKGDYHSYFQAGKLASYLKEEFPEIVHSTSFKEGQCKIAYKTNGFYCNGSFVDSSFFEMFTYPFIKGDVLTSLKQPNTIIITESLCSKLFGSENPIGKLVKLNEETNYYVTGVIKDIPQNSHMQFDVLMPFSNAHDWMKTWDSKWTQTYVMLQNGSKLEEVNKKIAGVMNLFQPSWNDILYLVPITKSHLCNLDGGGLIVYIWIFSLMALIVLLLACINFMNLSTSRSDLRYKEIFIKRLTGFKRSQVSLQFLSEALLLSFISLFVAVVLAKFSLPLINNILQSHLQLTFTLSTFFTLLTITIFTGIVAGSYPAFYLSRIKPEQIIRKTFQKQGSKMLNLRYALVLFQFSISIFFICCTLSIFNQIHYIQSKDIGIEKENIIRLNTVGKLSEKAIELKQELLKNPNIRNITVSHTDLTSWNNSGPIEWEGKEKDELIEIGYNWVDHDFLKTFNLKMKEGRFFSEDFVSDQSHSFILNEKAITSLKIKNPIGKKVTSWFGMEGTIIGVVEDFNTTSLHDKLGPIALLATNKSNHMFIAIKGHDMPGTLNFISKKIRELVPDDPVDYHFFANQVNYLYRTEALTGKMAIILSILAILISCMGLWGLTLSTIGQKTKEIGIRKVNGARVTEVMAMLNRDFIKWVAIAFVIACPIAWFAMHKWLQNFAYKTDLSWWVFAVAGLVALGIAMLTVSWQSWRAATRNPVES